MSFRGNLFLTFLLLFASTHSYLRGDEIMGKIESEQIHQTINWAFRSFLGEKPFPPPIELRVLRQDFGLPRFGYSCMDTPLKIGNKEFKYGIGTHANSEILISIPKGATKFRAFVGIDNNSETQGHRGSVVFSLEADGKVLVRTPILRGGDSPYLLEIPIPPEARNLLLKVDSTPDGPGWDHADWADAQILMENGEVIRIDEGQNTLLLMESETPPFSFLYAGIPSSELIEGWEKKAEKIEEKDWFSLKVSWLDPETKLSVEADVRVFKDFPAVEWVIYFENEGEKDTPIIENIRALDIKLATGNLRREAIIHQIHGDSCDDNTFLPFDSSLPLGKSLQIAPTGGRPSSISGFPFMNLQYEERGVILAVGWTGQWMVSFDRPDTPTCETHLRAGMELTHLKLHPGERIRTPRILLLPWKGDRMEAHNLFRRLMLAHFVRRIDGKLPEMPIALAIFDRYISRPGWATEEGQLEGVRAAHRLGCDTFWLDAAWFEGDFPNGVGNWYPKPKAFPNGLKPISDLCHKLGMRFVLWVEPERVAPGTMIAREHPEWVFGGEKGGLFKLNEPSARRWLTELLSRIIEEYGVDIYRNDFNIDPLPFWRANDEPDRQGMTEIRYVEGLYEMWDELARRHPKVLFDNCASGGRRIDLEMLKRAVVMTRSDTGCWPGHPEWNQTQSYGLAFYIPFFATLVWEHTPYEFRSAQSAGVDCEWGYLEEDFPWDFARKMVVEARENKKFWLGDFYPLTPISKGLDQIVAYQFHRPDLKEGIIYAFRRPECSYKGIILEPRAISPSETYILEFIDDSLNKKRKKIKGEDILREGLEIRLPEKKSSLIIRYKQL